MQIPAKNAKGAPLGLKDAIHFMKQCISAAHGTEEFKLGAAYKTLLEHQNVPGKHVSGRFVASQEFLQQHGLDQAHFEPLNELPGRMKELLGVGVNFGFTQKHDYSMSVPPVTASRMLEALEAPQKGLLARLGFGKKPATQMGAVLPPSEQSRTPALRGMQRWFNEGATPGAGQGMR